MKLILSFLLAWPILAVGHITLLFERPRKVPTAAEVAPQSPAEWPYFPHILKAYVIRTIGYDVQWWVKALAAYTFFPAVITAGLLYFF